MRTTCVQDIENISSCSFCVYPIVPIRLEKVIKYEAKKMMSIIYLKTLNSEWGQIDPKHNRRVKRKHFQSVRKGTAHDERHPPAPKKGSRHLDATLKKNSPVSTGAATQEDLSTLSVLVLSQEDLSTLSWSLSQ